MNADLIHQSGIVACVWDFDKTLIDGYMQKPLFARFEVNEREFWREVNALPGLYAERGTRISPDTQDQEPETTTNGVPPPGEQA